MLRRAATLITVAWVVFTAVLPLAAPHGDTAPVQVTQA
jgi:hypothetical protein